MKPTAAFRALTSNRKARQNVGGYTVHAVTKSGTPSKAVTPDHTGRTEFTLEQATTLQARLQELNPGRTWAVVAV